MKAQIIRAGVVVGMLLALAACNKEQESRQIYDEGEQTKDVMNQIRKFRSQIQSVKEGSLQRDEGTITLEEALWDIENEFNIAHTRSADYYSETAEHSFTLYLPILDDNSVKIRDVVALYELVEDNARMAYARDGFENKGFISLKIKSGEVNGGWIRLDFTGRTGNRTNYNPPTYYPDGPFNETDDWLFSAPMGKCDDPDIPSGADEQLQEKLYDVLIPDQHETDTGYRTIFVNRKQFIVNGKDYPGLFYCEDEDCYCILHYLMNSYYQGIKRLLTQILPEQYHLNGYHLDAFEIRGIHNPSEHYITHQIYAEYGQHIQISVSEFGDVEDLLE